MELGLILMACVSAGAGLALRSIINRQLGRTLLMIGFGALLLAAVAFILMIGSQGRILAPWIGSMVVLISLVLAVILLPFGFALSWGR